MNTLPLPALDSLTTPFWEGCRQRRLLVQRCPATGNLLFPPRYRSPWAPELAPEWVEVSGRGTIWSAAEPHPPLVEPFASLAPYNIVIVSLAEDPGVRLVGNLVAGSEAEINSVPWQDIKLGQNVQVVFQPVEPAPDGETWWFPRWVYSEP